MAPLSVPPRRLSLQWWAMGLLVAGLIGVPQGGPLGGLVIGLVALTALKLREAKGPAEKRLVGLLQLLGVGLLAALRPELAASLLQALIAVVALAGLLAQQTGDGLSARWLLRRSLQVVLAALPMALLLFVLMPRLGPFTALPAAGGATALTGLNETLDPGGIARLANSGALAARVAFPGGAPPPVGERYWRVLVHERFDGSRWHSGESAQSEPFVSPKGLAGASASPSELWLTEASGLLADPWSGRGEPQDPELMVDSRGQLRHRERSVRPRSYGLAHSIQQTGWKGHGPAPQERSWPVGSNPRLEQLATDWAKSGSPSQRLAAAEAWFQRQGFRYSREPGILPAQAPLDTFLFDRREGFCGHFASSFSALMRAAGVPARVVSGYRGGEWVEPIGGSGYLELRLQHSHAWSEVWIAPEGWRAVDPSAWIEAGGIVAQDSVRTGPVRWLVRQWWGLDMAWNRWWLGFDSQRQSGVLRALLGDRLEWLGPLLLAATAGALAIGVRLYGWLWKPGRTDPARRELERLIGGLALLGVAPEPGETLPRLAQRLRHQWPRLGAPLQAFVELYQMERYGPQGSVHSPGIQGRRLDALKRHRRQLLKEIRRSRP